MPDLVKALQFGDSMFPVGAFSFSHGVESAIAEGVVHDEKTLAQWVRSATRTAAKGDAVALLHAHRAAHRAAHQGDLEGAVRADRAVLARKLNEETRTMTVRTGRKLAEAAARIVPGPGSGDWLGLVVSGHTPGTYPAGLGVVCALLGLSGSDAFAMHQHGVATTAIGAAVRLMPLHHLAAQAILYEVNGCAGEDYAIADGRLLADMSGFAPQADVLASVHVRAHVRMFMN